MENPSKKAVKLLDASETEMQKSNFTKIESKLTFECQKIEERMKAENSFIVRLLKVLDDDIFKCNNVENDPDLDDYDMEKPLKAEVDTTKNVKQKLQKKLGNLKGKKGYQSKKERQKLSKMLKKEMLDRKTEKKIVPISHASGNANVDTTSVKKYIKPVYNQEGKMVFNKFDFCIEGEIIPEKKNSGIDSKTLFEKLEKAKKNMQALKERGETEEVETLMKKKMWQDALNKIHGVKVKDNPDLLKKTVKRNQQQKDKKRKKWQETKENLVNKKEMKQKKRLDHMQNRRQEKLQHKRKRAAKKGRGLPGF